MITQEAVSRLYFEASLFICTVLNCLYCQPPIVGIYAMDALATRTIGRCRNRQLGQWSINETVV